MILVILSFQLSLVLDFDNNDFTNPVEDIAASSRVGALILLVGKLELRCSLTDYDNITSGQHVLKNMCSMA